MLASGSYYTSQHRASTHAMRSDGASATLRARNDRASAIPRPRNNRVSPVLRGIVLGALMFGALSGGLWAGMTSAAVLCAAREGCDGYALLRPRRRRALDLSIERVGQGCSEWRWSLTR